MNYLNAKEAVSFLRAKGFPIYEQLLYYYCKTGRAPDGSVKIAGRWVFVESGLATWSPEKRKIGRKRND